jgi:outer membrane lipoprotein carrier protein
MGLGNWRDSWKFATKFKTMTRMKTFRIVMGLLAFTALFTFGQAQSNPKSDKVIKASQDKFNSLADVTADFSYTLNNPEMKKPVAKTGTVILKKNKYKIVFADEEMYCNGKYTWVVLKADKEIMKNDFNPKEDLSPDRLYKTYKEGAKSDYNGEEAGAHKVTVFANNDDGDIWKTVLWINIESKMIDKAIMYGRNGSQYTYLMSNIKVNTGVTDAIFNLDEKKYIDQDWILTNQSEN